MTTVREQAPAAEERVLPHSAEAERSVLGVALVAREAWPRIAAMLVPEDFYREAHVRIFRTMTTLAEAGTPIDFVPLVDALRVAGDLDEVGGPAYVSSLATGVPRATNVEYYAAMVREKARLRAAIYAANGIAVQAYGEDPVAEIIETGVRRLMRLADQPLGGAVTIGQAIASYMTALDTDAGLGIETGLVDLDRHIGGFKRKDLILVAARPSVGKTSLATTIADNVAGRAIPAALFTLEMDTHAIAANILAGHSRVQTELMRRKLLGERQWVKIAEAIETLNDRPLYLIEAARNLTQVAAAARLLRDEHGIEMFLIDYIQMMAPADAPNRNQLIGYVSHGLKRMAADLNVPVVALAQLSRAPEQRTDKRPQLSDLRESGNLEQDADQVLMLFREEMYKPTADNAGIAEVIIAKNRSGPTGVVKLAFLRDLAHFENLAMV